MKKETLVILLLLLSLGLAAQKKSYADSITDFRDQYVRNHEVVRGADKKSMHFFPVNNIFRVTARFERIYEAPWSNMETSGKEKKLHRVYGVLHFNINDTVLTLQVYQSKALLETEKYAAYLFIPYTDRTCGEESYDNGRYIDLMITDIQQNSYTIDFNKAYNPYCAYISGRYNCPVPPRDNDLPVAIRAGEMKFEKAH